MKVWQLINELSNLDPDAEILLFDFINMEYSSVTQISEKFGFNKDDPDYLGEVTENAKPAYVLGN